MDESIEAKSVSFVSPTTVSCKANDCKFHENEFDCQFKEIIIEGNLLKGCGSPRCLRYQEE
jgi:hypothetical protein